jgi:hypothetical protein
MLVGLDYENAMKDPFFLQETLIPFSNRLLTFPSTSFPYLNCLRTPSLR